MINSEISKKTIEAYLKARSIAYAIQGFPIYKTQKWFSTSNSSRKLNSEDVYNIKKEVESLFKKDAEGFLRRDYPISLLWPSKPLEHSKTFFNILVDNFSVSIRKRKRKERDFSNKIKKDIQKYPDYYQRNFHFQTDGYLSLESASRYEHQVEILFKGTAEPMRRRLVSLIKKHCGFGEKEGLELGCGVGSASKMMALSFPEDQFYCLDLSPAYLTKARKNYSNIENLHFVKGHAEDLKYKEQSFDLVYSVYLHHELPEEVRKKTFQEAKRVLKPGGFFAVCDSTQLGDNPHLDWAIKDFPKNFHEPFYTNYIKKSLELMGGEAGFSIIDKDISFLTKTLLFQKT